jgi:mRNA-degrading endonuclease toxin of MazEF toxin-antitoxin module
VTFCSATSTRYAAVPGLLIAVPLTSRYRGLEHHIEVPADGRTGLKQVSYAMTEQVRAMSSVPPDQQKPAAVPPGE